MLAERTDYRMGDTVETPMLLGGREGVKGSDGGWTHWRAAGGPLNAGSGDGGNLFMEGGSGECGKMAGGPLLEGGKMARR